MKKPDEYRSIDHKILQKRLDNRQKVIIDSQPLEERSIFTVQKVIKSWVMAFCSIR